jgi:DNA topoisomerase-1
MATKKKPVSEKKTEDFKYLVIVESPAKSKTLTKILGNEYLVKSSIGHIRDLPAKGLGIDIKKDFEPTYEIMVGKEKVVDELNDFAKLAEKVYLASDPDREGEAIAWHLEQILKCKKSNVTRVTFNQITPDAVRSAVANPRDIDMSLVNAQQARRILDRLVGYKISPILWRKIGGRSAGRVQSIAVRLICEREEEIKNFIPEEYWSLISDVIEPNKNPNNSKGENFEIRLTHVDHKRVISPNKEYDSNKSFVISSKEEMDKILGRIDAASLAVTHIGSKPSTKKSKPPFKTSTLQRAASNAMGYTVKRTMQIAQSLYEGVKIGKGSAEQVGLITYMRTDSLRIAPEAQEAAKEYIINKYGKDYYPEVPNIYDKSKKANEQDAHEAIRPTYVDKDPESIREYLSDEQYRLYRLIWQRFVTSQMSEMKLDIKSMEIASADKLLQFRVSQSKVIFKGYSIVYGNYAEQSEDNELSEENVKFPDYMQEGSAVKVITNKPSQHFTEGPPRFNEASLVKTLEELGIGRPSTYAPTISTVLDRNYVEKVNTAGALAPTKLGMSVNELLVNHFGQFINTDFTSQMEADLDMIAHDEIKWQKVLKDFYKGPEDEIAPPKSSKKAASKTATSKTSASVETKTVEEHIPLGFESAVKKASKEIESVVIETEHECPTCAAKMHLKSSRFGPFLGCSNYPDCNTIVNLTKDGKPAPDDRPYTVENCPTCTKDQSLVIRYGRYGDYIACVTKDCGYTSPLVKKTGVHCPREGCGGEIVEKKSRFGKMFYGCNKWSVNNCDMVFWYPPIDLKCPQCSKQMMFKSLKKGDKVACSDTKNCGYNRLALVEEIEKYAKKSDPEAPEEQKSVFSL